MSTVIPHKAAFVHIPKTAGLSVKAALVPHGGIHCGMHTRAVEMKANIPYWNDIFTFAFVRNPWAQAVSTYEMCKKGETFAEFLRLPEYRWIWLTHQSSYVADEGRQLVSFIGRFENLRQDWQHVCTKIGVAVELPKINSNVLYDYHDYYNDQTKAVIANAHARDIQLFGYAF